MVMLWTTKWTHTLKDVECLMEAVIYALQQRYEDRSLAR